jgi:hypothetical protein
LELLNEEMEEIEKNNSSERELDGQNDVLMQQDV